jgi:hypothetical protein
MVERDSTELTYVLATIRKTSAASISNLKSAYGALVASYLNNLNDVGVILIAAHRHLYALVNDRALLIYTAPHGRRLTGNDDLGHLREVFEQGSFKGEARNFAQNAVFQMLYLGIKLSHLG